MRSRWMCLVPVAAVIGLTGAPDALGQSAPPATKVSMKDFAYMPATVTVGAGTTVTWTYDESASDPMPNCESPQFRDPSPVTCPGHSVTSVDHLFDTGVHRADGFPFSYTFSTPGTYKYYCTVHGGPNPNNPLTHMDGTIVVTAAAGQPAGSPSSSPSAPPPAAGGGSTLPLTGGRPLTVLGGLLLLAGLCLSARLGTTRASRAGRPRGSGPSSRAPAPPSRR